MSMLHTIFFKPFRVAAIIICGLISTQSFADYSLNKGASQLNFVSIKNEHKTEIHSFDLFTGSLSDVGELTINIELASVNTLIPIRNERMQSMLFNTGLFPTAIFQASIDKNLLNIGEGKTKNISINGNLKIQDRTVPILFEVVITGLSNGALQATTVKPTMLSTTRLGLDNGVEALKKIANLESISKTVPVSFSVVFEK